MVLSRCTLYLKLIAMKHLVLLFIVATTFLSSCKKEKPITAFTVSVNKDNPYSAVLRIDGTPYTFTDAVFNKIITLDEYQVITIDLDYSSSQTDIMDLTVYKNGQPIATVSGDEHMYVILSTTSVYSGGGSSGSGSSSGSTWHYCGAPTKDGTPCRRHVSGTSGYCWQHK